MTSTRSRTVLFTGVCAAAALGLTACGSSGGGSLDISSKTAKPSKSASATPTPSPSASMSASPGAGAGTSGGTGTGSGGTGTGSGGTGTGSGGAGGGTSITLSLTQKPSCPSGTNLFHYAGNPAIISWNVTGASGVTLYLDGSSGKYGDYGPSGSQTLNFSCSGPPNTTQTHTYTIVATGGAPASKTISASAFINEITAVSSPTPAPVFKTIGPPPAPPTAAPSGFKTIGP